MKETHMKNNSRISKFKGAVLLAITASLSFHVMAQTTPSSADQGKQAYVKNGCWGCHGFVGQGGIAGPKLAPDPKPIEYIDAFVRNTRGTMPPYSEKILSKKDLADIYTYLKSIPKGPDYKSIPLLN
jgi:ubiquinol-cytochrome c reductase cytochrome c subunit